MALKRFDRSKSQKSQLEIPTSHLSIFNALWTCKERDSERKSLRMGIKSQRGRERERERGERETLQKTVLTKKASKDTRAITDRQIKEKDQKASGRGQRE